MGGERSSPTMNRRRALSVLGTAAAAATFGRSAIGDEGPPRRTGMGLVIYCQRYRREQLKQQKNVDLYEPLRFLEHCRSLGAGGIQANLGVLDISSAKQIRERAENWNMYVEAIIKPPKDDADVGRFEAEVRTAKDAGAVAARTTIIPGRRYERFDTLEEYRRFSAMGTRMLERAAPVVEKHRLPFAVENHKDHRTDERVGLFKHIGSEYVGACVDTGNTFALLEDAQETVAALAPWAFSVHLKDQGVKEYDDGFLLADVPLGKGIFDLERMVETLVKLKPDVRFSLELITRNALKVPVLTDEYWATFPELPGHDLARTMRTVRGNPTESFLDVESLPLDEQVAEEEKNVRESIAYAGNVLKI